VSLFPKGPCVPTQKGTKDSGRKAYRKDETFKRLRAKENKRIEAEGV
jgi:hypothetical protein